MQNSIKEIQVSQYIDGDFFEQLGEELHEDVLYSRIDDVNKAFQKTEHKKILITHNGDRCVSESQFSKFKRCGLYNYWLAQNVNFLDEHLINIPIGLERVRHIKGYSKRELIHEYTNKEIKPTKVLYGNFSLSNATAIRTKCYETFKGKEYFTDHVDINVKRLSSTQAGYEKFLAEVLDHKFVLCPEGHGIDTHRLYEVLYLGRIPVVLHNIVNDSLKKLPILILDKWEDFENVYEDYYQQYLNNIDKFDFSILTKDYWRTYIKELCYNTKITLDLRKYKVLDLRKYKVVDSNITKQAIKSMHCKLEDVDKIILTRNAILQNNAFKDFINLKIIENISTATLIGQSIFENCSSLQTISIGKQENTIIPSSCFKNCKSLKTVEHIENIKIIKNNVFENCTALTSLVISNCTFIGKEAFKGCSALTQLTAPNCLSAYANAFEDTLFFEYFNSTT